MFNPDDPNTWTEEGRRLYEGKFFYEIVRETDCLKLFGPLNTIYYCNPRHEASEPSEYAFVQVIDGQVMQAFTKDEILVTDKKL